MNSFKMRAECLPDVLNALTLIKPASFAIVSPMSLDCYISFTSSLSLAQIQALLSTVVDGHVMERTLEAN